MFFDISFSYGDIAKKCLKANQGAFGTWRPGMRLLLNLPTITDFYRLAHLHIIINIIFFKFKKLENYITNYLPKGAVAFASAKIAR